MYYVILNATYQSYMYVAVARDEREIQRGFGLIMVTFGFTKEPRVHAGQWDAQRRQTKLTQVPVRIAISPFDYSKFGNNLISG